MAGSCLYDTSSSSCVSSISPPMVLLIQATPHSYLNYPVSISFAVIVASLALAFSSWIRNLISFLASVSWAAFTEYTYLRHLWNFCIQKNNSKGLHQRKRKLTARIYNRRQRMKNGEALERAKVVEKSTRDYVPLKPVRSRRPSQGRRTGSVGIV
jgi:hypothetical protein